METGAFPVAADSRYICPLICLIPNPPCLPRSSSCEATCWQESHQEVTCKLFIAVLHYVARHIPATRSDLFHGEGKCMCVWSVHTITKAWLLIDCACISTLTFMTRALLQHPLQHTTNEAIAKPPQYSHLQHHQQDVLRHAGSFCQGPAMVGQRP